MSHPLVHLADRASTARCGSPVGTTAQVRSLLSAADPATARHISFELAQYFVADQPSAALVERLTRRYLESGGDIRAVLATLFASAEFRDPAARGVKFKTPYQYVVSALRAAELPTGNVRPLLGALNQLGMPLFG